MLKDLLGGIRVILGSQSPRRKELLAKIGVDFEVIVKETDESYDSNEKPENIVRSIALGKINGFDGREFDGALVITSDTIVVCKGMILGKPVDKEEAFRMLNMLQGCTHEVMTAVAIAYNGEVRTFVENTKVAFDPLTEAEISFYIEQYQPYDKAGAYGIQEWIGFVGVKRLEGSYENVVGLPTARLYKELKEILSNK